MEKIKDTAGENVLAMSPEEFSQAGHMLVDRITEFLKELPQKPVTSAKQPSQIRAILGNPPLPQEGAPAESLLDEAAGLLFDHSLFNGHPSFWGYITSSATPIGALGDFLAAAVNPNVGAYALSPMATEIERQTIQWLAEFIGYPAESSGVFVSGGNMANFVGFLAARKAKAGWNIRKMGLNGFSEEHVDFRNKQLLIYCSRGTHTWIEKAADLFGFGTNAIRWIDLNKDQQIDLVKLNKQINQDRIKGYTPFILVGTAGSVGTGVVDDLATLAKISRLHGLWFHVDGAYGAPAAVLPELYETFNGLSEADSVAIDPHKWLYSPLEAGCILVRDRRHLTDAFSFHPEYFNFDGSAEDPAINFYDYGLQNSRGFRALKVWLGIRQAGKTGYQKLIRKDIELAKKLFHMVAEEEELEAITQNLSITTFRFVPKKLNEQSKSREQYINKLNEGLLNALQSGGKVFLSNAIVDGKYCLRVCIVNFRTTLAEIKELVKIVLEEGRQLDSRLSAGVNLQSIKTVALQEV